MQQFPVFLSVVCVLRNQSGREREILSDLQRVIAPLVSDYELIVVDNASTDGSVASLQALTGEGGLPNLQVYALTKEVDNDTASWAALENALGDFVLVIDPQMDDIQFLPTMLDQALGGCDVVFARNAIRPRQSLSYRIAAASFNGLYAWFNGINLAREAPGYRMLSRSVINFILQHRNPALSYRHLPASGGFSKVTLNYSAQPRGAGPKRLGESVDRGIRLLVSTTRAPMRLVTSLSMFGAGANLLYSLYVVAIAIFKDDVAPGWVSLSMQQSGMFFLISLVLLVLGEYILNMPGLSDDGPVYHVAKEFTSAKVTRREKLNIEEPARQSARYGGL